MKRVLFVNFSKDYEFLEVQSLSKKYEVDSFYLSYKVRAILEKLYVLFPNIISKVVFFILSKKVSTDFDVVITNENKLYHSLMPYFSKDVKKIVMLRNKYDNSLTLDSSSHYYSFDSDDCNIFGFKFYNQYCSGFDFLIDNKDNDLLNINSSDVFFLGRDKGRLSKLEKIRKDNQTLNICYHIVAEPESFFQRVLKFLSVKKYATIPYIENLKLTLRSRSVLEIGKDDQVGFTMRVFEALCAGKKVITNNKSILNTDLYDESLIYIIDDFEEENDLSEFLNQEQIHINLQLLEKYSPYYVISNIIED